MIAGLTTHVLDTSRGRPAAGLRIDFSAVEPDGTVRLIGSSAHLTCDLADLAAETIGYPAGAMFALMRNRFVGS
jgi:5-hydroxyisourate hydrolase-like protein (transthyretin family)